ncbi:hypothetical protein [Gallaecimonas sp. GXIMD4217]|uniref:hypothetical protein n=1 Tax=Gallaecimonas sp. GXIMD4217 TaxID=3131927 RepID=UPI00311B2419
MKLAYPLLLVPALALAGADFGADLGQVELKSSCTKPAQAELAEGLALLHHMTYEGAKPRFEKAAVLDPNCALAYWGQAMALVHPLWSDPPDATEYAQGQQLVAKARQAEKQDDREKAMVAALAAYFEGQRQDSEKPHLKAFAAAWRQAHEAFPDDVEVAAFTALSHLALADPGDKSYRVQLQSGAMAEKLLAGHPRHPGAHHYLIHSYDYPPLAEKAVAASRSYGAIAPAVPHALHMPTHIFTRLGLWQDVIDMNQLSAKAALAHPAGNKVSLHYLHALDYQAYGYLQKGRDDLARAIQDKMDAIGDPIQPHVASAYALAGIPARRALESQSWAEAAGLKARQPAGFPWDRFPAMEAISHFAVAMGAARAGQPEKAQAALKALERLQGLERSPYWAKQAQIQLLSARAWAAYEGGDEDKGLALMQEAAALEAGTEKHPVTPGEILPARELLADMLLDMDRFQEALAAYELALKRSPNRFNSLFGAAVAAQQLGEDDKARGYYRQLVELAGDSRRAAVSVARAVLKGED